MVKKQKINIKVVPGSKMNNKGSGKGGTELIISNLKLPPLEEKKVVPVKTKGLKSIKFSGPAAAIAKARTEIVKGQYFFTDEEKANMANLLAQKQLDKRIVEDERKSVMSDFKDRIDRFVWEINRLSRGVVDGFEMRDFECRIFKDFGAHVKIYYDIHSNREIARRPLDPSDYQKTFEDPS